MALRVFYGWAKTNKVRKIESISVIYENRPQRDEKVESFLKRMQNTVYIRQQTEGEVRDGELSNRMYTEYSIRMTDKNIGGSLSKALDANYVADNNNVSESERDIIRQKLRNAYMSEHPDYREPCG